MQQSVSPSWHSWLIWTMTTKYQIHRVAQVGVGPYSRPY